MTEAISVTALNQYVKGLLERAPILNGVLVRGELSNYKRYPSGHHYFTLKDAESSIRCVLFRREAASLRFVPENGTRVIAGGRVSLYPRDGAYQLYCTSLVPDGVGALALAFEQCKERLRQEGLFDQARKRPLPAFPKRIALVTSPAGAAVRDMIRILGQRWPLTEVVVVPVHVQGEGAAEEIAAALDLVGALGGYDLVITGRGGGSMEDLWAFNEEVVARAIVRCPVPVISAVGHEPDVTIADFAADVRAATPSHAAELAVPDRAELAEGLDHLSARMGQAMARTLSVRRQGLDRLAHSHGLHAPLRQIQEQRLQLDRQSDRLRHAAALRLSGDRQRLSGLAASLDALSPFKVLARGYAIAQAADGRVVSSTEQVAPGDALTVRVTDGTVACTVTGKEERQWRRNRS